MRFRAVPLFVLAALPLAGCFEPTFEGKYRDGAGDTIEFLKSGAFLVTHHQERMSGRYELIQDNRAMFRFDGLAGLTGAQTCNYRFENSDLVFSNCFLAGKILRVS